MSLTATAPAKPKHLAFDPTFGDETAAQLRAALEGGDYRHVSRTLAAAQDPNLREFYVNALHEWEGRPFALERWTEEAGDDPAAWLVAGTHSTCWAWEARGSGRAETVTKDMGEVFFERLELASDELTRAIELAPADPLPHAYRIIVCLGLNLPRTQAVGSFKEAIARYPEHHAAHRLLLNYLCEKWHGSHEEMFDLARAASDSAPDGSLVHVLIAQAHAERWLHAVHFAKEPWGEDYFRQSHVREEVLAAYDRSLGSPHYRPGPLTRIVANDWAYALARCGDWEGARREFERVGDFPTVIPWGFHDEPMEALRTFRSTVQRDPSQHRVPNAAAQSPKPWWKFW